MAEEVLADYNRLANENSTLTKTKYAMRKIKNFIFIIKNAGKRWLQDKASVLAAALAFYSGLALAPMLIVAVILAGIFLNGADIQQRIEDEVAATIGDDAAELVASMIEDGFDPSAGRVAVIVSLVSIFFSASGLFTQVENAFNYIWRDNSKNRKGLGGFLLSRLRALLMIFSIGFILILTIVVSTLLSAFAAIVEDSQEVLADRLSPSNFELLDTAVGIILPTIDFLFSILVLTFLFGWMFRRIPSAKLRTRDVRAGAIVTAILFWLGKLGLTFYISRGSVGSAYGAAGSLLVMLVFIYYSAQIMLFGVEYTYVDATTFGSRSKPAIEPAHEKAQDSNSATIDSTQTPP